MMTSVPNYEVYNWSLPSSMVPVFMDPLTKPPLITLLVRIIGTFGKICLLKQVITIW